MPGGGTQGKFGWGCEAHSLKPLPYFRKICDFPDPFSDLTKNSIPYFRL